MQDTDAPWPPTRGDVVLVKATGERGIFVGAIGEGDDRRFVVSFPVARGSDDLINRHSYRPDELAPDPRPQRP